MSLPYRILAYYHFAHIEDPEAEVKIHKDFLAKCDATARIYISEQGINGQMSLAAEDATSYMEWMRTRPLFQGIQFKAQDHHEHVFPRLTIKYRKQLVAFDADVSLEKRGEHVAPQQWKEMLEEQNEHVLLDVRNDYEWKIGHFEGAELPPCETFRDFDRYAQELQERIDPKKTPVMMYCTGGIRCELYSAILKEKGFEKVYQLEGGIINYGMQQGNDHWLGKVFVFDDRLAAPICENKESKTIGACHHCGEANDTYYNCANMDCNELFLCCPECLSKFLGCCHEECKQADRVRPYHPQNSHKPFRRWHHYFNEKTPLE